MSAFFMLAISGLGIANAESCSLDTNTKVEKAIVKWVYDGDTLLVTDIDGSKERKIRIIGIDTPEVKHHQQKAQLYGAKAKEELRVLIKEANYQIFLEFDKDKRDRYKRDLAHVYLKNGQNVSQWLLEEGFAKILVIPPNVKHIDCYKKAESQAQQGKKRIWKLKANRVKTANDFKSRSKGYVRLKGKISRLKKQKKSFVLDLETNRKKSINLRIKKKNLGYFDERTLEELVNEEVIVSGILKNQKGKRTIYLNHSVQLERLTGLKKDSKAKTSPSIKWSTKK